MLRGNQAHIFQQLPWAFKACQVTHFGHQSDGNSALHPTQGLQGVDHRGQPPGVDVLMQFLFKALEMFAMFAHGTDIFLKNDLVSRRGTDDLREPPQVGRTPIGAAGVTDIVSEQEGFETKFGIFAIADGIFTRAGEMAENRFTEQEVYMASSRARVRSRMAASSTMGT
jgi:hypothetical protein